LANNMSLGRPPAVAKTGLHAGLSSTNPILLVQGAALRASGMIAAVANSDGGTLELFRAELSLTIRR
jgi:hypothetical protein